jgi:hemolysin D
VLQIEALVANLDIGFVKLGQGAAIKVDAFPFTRFGVLHGKVMRIASEAVEEQEAKRGLANAPATANAAGAPPASQAGQPQSFVFPVTVALDEQAMNIDGVSIPLTTGMTVTVEIKTDSRRVIDYLLSPLAKIASEALKER